MTTKSIAILATSGVSALFAFILLMSALYTVDEREYGLELRFGEVRNVRNEPGLYIKAPFIDSVQSIDKRTLRADMPPREVPDRDKERLVIEVIIRYAIEDPLAFRKTLRNEATAKERLQAITYSAMRDTIGQHDRTEVIGAEPVLGEDGRPFSDEDGLPVYRSLLNTRDEINSRIEDRISEAVSSQGYGIRVISADIKRADFPPQVRASIIDRLWAERQRIAARHRADGEEEYLRRTAGVQAEADIITSLAQRDARETRGEGDAEAIRIVQEALNADPEFYRFLRRLESYERSIVPGAVVVLGADGYLDTLVQGPPAAGVGGISPQHDGDGYREIRHAGTLTADGYREIRHAGTLTAGTLTADGYREIQRAGMLTADDNSPPPGEDPDKDSR